METLICEYFWGKNTTIRHRQLNFAFFSHDFLMLCAKNPFPCARQFYVIGNFDAKCPRGSLTVSLEVMRNALYNWLRGIFSTFIRSLLFHSFSSSLYLLLCLTYFSFSLSFISRSQALSNRVWTLISRKQA